MATNEERERLDRVFGDVLPDATRDERGNRPEPDSEEELRRNIPPHHGAA